MAMKPHVEYQFRCDVDGCPGNTVIREYDEQDGNVSNLDEAEDQLIDARGWDVLPDGRHFCPMHPTS